MAEIQSTIVIEIKGEEILDQMKDVLKAIKQERKRIAKLVKEAS